MHLEHDRSAILLISRSASLGRMVLTAAVGEGGWHPRWGLFAGFTFDRVVIQPLGWHPACGGEIALRNHSIHFGVLLVLLKLVQTSTRVSQQVACQSRTTRPCGGEVGGEG